MRKSISHKIALASLSITMTIVLILGVVSYLFTHWNMQIQEDEKLQFEVSLIKNRLEALLHTLDHEVENLATNLIIVNALIDSEGSNIYVEPFLRTYKLPVPISFTLTLYDFEGKPIVTNQKKAHAFDDKSILNRLIEKGWPFAEIREIKQTLNLVLAYPVIHGATEMPEGVLVMEIPFSIIPQTAIGPIYLAGKTCAVLYNNQKIWQNTGTEKEVSMSISTDLELDGPLADLSFSILFTSDQLQDTSLFYRLITIYSGIAVFVFFITFFLSRLVARRLTQPLMLLANEADKVAAAGFPDEQIVIASNDEVQVLASSFNSMLKNLRESHQSLESRVAERTHELNNLNRQLQQEISERHNAEKNLRKFADTQTVLLREVNHRVKNNLIAIISMLHQEQDRADSESMGLYAVRLGEVVERISGLLIVHSLLAGSLWQPLPLSDLCQNIIQAASKWVPAKNIFQLDIPSSDILIDSDQAHYLTIVLNELAMNSVKYAFHNKNIIHVRVNIQRQGNNINLCYHDDGPGYPDFILRGEFPENFIGFQLMNGVVKKSLQGTLTPLNDNGATVLITFPRGSL